MYSPPLNFNEPVCDPKLAAVASVSVVTPPTSNVLPNLAARVAVNNPLTKVLPSITALPAAVTLPPVVTVNLFVATVN